MPAPDDAGQLSRLAIKALRRSGPGPRLIHKVPVTCGCAMDPLMHLALPLLFLLALRVDARRAVLLAPLAILPDFDALFGLHRALGHSFVPILVLPMAVLAYSHFKRREWVPAALVAQFYLASHVVLDLGGVAFLWPIVEDQFFIELGVTFTASDGFGIGLTADWGMKELAEMGTTSLLSDYGFAILFLGALTAAVFRREALRALRSLASTVRSLPASVRALFRRR